MLYRPASKAASAAASGEEEEPASIEDLTLMIDNYDSFTFNIVQYLAELGATVKVVRNDAATIEEIQQMKPARIVVSPGPGTPAEAGISKATIEAFAGQIPVLGVCLGHQSIFEVYGGTVDRAPSVMHGKTSPLFHDGAGLYQGLPQKLHATRYHSLVGLPETLPEELVVTSRVVLPQEQDTEGKKQPDGGDENSQVDEASRKHVIMGVRHRKFTVEGLQFHPESICTEHGKQMLRNFLNMTGGTWEEAGLAMPTEEAAQRAAIPST